MTTPISTIILTFNEEKHIERCILNARRFSKEIFVVDSFSTDNTIEIAKRLGAIVYQNKWEKNYARQFNWGLTHLPVTSEWVFRLDADEYLSDELIDELSEKMPALDRQISGISFERKMIFMDKMITRGMPQMHMLRLFKIKDGHCEDRWMDEHIVLTKGKTARFEGSFVDHNLNTLGWWIAKHNGYAIREAVDLLLLESSAQIVDAEQEKLTSIDAMVKRKNKLRYSRLPLFWRSFAYFIYRYIFKLGFVDGKVGFIWHFMQGWWYRSLVDAKILEIKKHCGQDQSKLRNYLSTNYQIEI
jgi:glycosyltransferase involved in cell wall biosynthesis